MRAFIAISIPDEARRILKELQEQLARSSADVKWVEPQNIHLTLKFLGEITPEQKSALDVILTKAVQAYTPFTALIEGVGGFPSLGQPKIVWVGLREQGTTHLARLAQAIEEGASALGVEKEERPFSAHITLGRMRSPRGKRELAQRLQALSVPGAWPQPPAWKIRAVCLYQSILSSSGPAYTRLSEYPLADAV